MGLSAEAVRVVEQTDNRDNSDVDLVEFNNRTIIMCPTPTLFVSRCEGCVMRGRAVRADSWGDQLAMPANEIAVAVYDGPLDSFLAGWF